VSNSGGIKLSTYLKRFTQSSHILKKEGGHRSDTFKLHPRDRRQYSI
jgi:hypothetical protein